MYGGISEAHLKPLQIHQSTVNHEFCRLSLIDHLHRTTGVSAIGLQQTGSPCLHQLRVHHRPRPTASFVHRPRRSILAPTSQRAHLWLWLRCDVLQCTLPPTTLRHGAPIFMRGPPRRRPPVVQIYGAEFGIRWRVRGIHDGRTDCCRFVVGHQHGVNGVGCRVPWNVRPDRTR